MKKLFFMGIAILAMSFAFIGSGHAQTNQTKDDPEPTAMVFNPASGSTVKEGDTVEITVNKQGIKTYYFYMYATLEEAQADEETSFDGESFLDKSIIYDKAKGQVPVITAEKPVIRAGYNYFDISSFDDVYESYYATYVVENDEPEPAAMVFNPASGSTVKEGDTVEITVNKQGVSTYYFYMYATMEEAQADEETDFGDGFVDKAIIYDKAKGQVPVITAEKPVIRAGYNYFDISSFDDVYESHYATYIVEKEEPELEVTFDPASESEVEEGTAINVTANRDVELVFALYADSLEAKEDTSFVTRAKPITETVKPVITKGKTFLKCAARGTQQYFYATYTIKETVVIEPMTFTLDPAAGSTVENKTQVIITPSRALGEDEHIIFAMFATLKEAQACTDEEMANGKGMFYGDSEDEKVPVITKEAPVLKVGYISGIDEEGENEFTWTYAEYTVKEVANEGLELAGVSVYPNPNEGQFSVNVPVKAQVEVFTATGMMVKYITVAEGTTQLRLENTGIYFVRFTAENGQVAIKRVIVR